MKIVIIATYFGTQKPWYFEYFLHTAINNSSIDFIFFTDLPNVPQSSNFKCINLSLADFRDKLNSKLGGILKFTNPMKLCDIRTSYGESLEEYLINYDFWGYCDIDVILGNLRNFFTDELLKKYDILFTKAEYPSGFFALFKNTSKINILYKSTRDYNAIFSSEKPLMFDECGGAYEEVCNGIDILKTATPFDSLHHILARNQDFKTLYEFLSIEGNPGRMRYVNGILSYNQEYEILLYHLTNFKDNFFTYKHFAPRIFENLVIARLSIGQDNSYNRLKFICRDLFKPKFWKLAVNVDMFLTRFFKVNFKKKILPGEYQYMNHRVVVEEKSNQLYLLYNGLHSCKLTILMFHKNIFFEHQSKTFFNMADESPNGYNSFYAISPFESPRKFTKV